MCIYKCVYIYIYITTSRALVQVFLTKTNYFVKTILYKNEFLKSNKNVPESSLDVLPKRSISKAEFIQKQNSNLKKALPLSPV